MYKRYTELELKKEKSIIQLEEDLDYEKFVMQQFSNFFNCYTKSFNKKFNRKGALFIDYLKRTLIDSDDYLKNIVYISIKIQYIINSVTDFKIGSIHPIIQSYLKIFLRIKN